MTKKSAVMQGEA